MPDGISGSMLGATWEGRVFDGSWYVPTGGDAAIPEPGTGGTLGRTGIGTAGDINAAADQAAAAQPAWAAVPPRERAEIMLKAATIFQENAEELALWVARESGGIIPKGQLEVREAVAVLRAAAAMTNDAPGLVLPSADGRLSIAKRVPHGVVGVISPFNFPLILSIRAVAPALAIGNAVILKPDPQTPMSGGLMIARAFEMAGLPAGVLHVLPGGADAGQALCEHKQIAMIAFTGSTAAGRRVGEICGRNLKKCSLELGGKNALIVLSDADVARAASNVAFGAYFHQGQICMASGRILVERSIAPALVAALVEKATHLPVGDPASGQVALGPLINERQRDKVHAIVTDSIAAGAKLSAGGTYDGLFYKPTVLENVSPGMRCFDEEIFGPVANIITFETDEEAIQLANSTEYGLSAGIISASVGRAMAIGQKLKTGLVHINDQTVGDEVANPFGGRGASGNGGSIGGPANWDEFSTWQWMTIQDVVPMKPF